MNLDTSHYFDFVGIAHAIFSHTTVQYQFASSLLNASLKQCSLQSCFTNRAVTEYSIICLYLLYYWRCPYLLLHVFAATIPFFQHKRVSAQSLDNFVSLLAAHNTTDGFTPDWLSTLVLTAAVYFCSMSFPYFTNHNPPASNVPASSASLHSFDRSRHFRFSRPIFFLCLWTPFASALLPALMKPHCSDDLNRLQRILHGNISFSKWNTCNPAQSTRGPPLYLPNGMIVYWLSWHDPTTFSIWFTRRGNPQKLTTKISESPTLYRNLAAAITSVGGEPGSRHQNDMVAFFHWREYHSRVSGYRNRQALRGASTHRGRRSQASTTRRWVSFVDTRRHMRRAYRSWHHLPGGSTTWVNECFQPKPLFRPTHPATRFNKRLYEHPTPSSKTACINSMFPPPAQLVPLQNQGL